MDELFRRSAELFTRPSFLDGYSRALDIGATLNVYNHNKTPQEADAAALKSDWQAVGDSIQFSINEISKEAKMPVQNLSKIFNKYSNKWVALTDDHKFIASGNTLKEALDYALKLGYDNPLTARVPDANLNYVI